MCSTQWMCWRQQHASVIHALLGNFRHRPAARQATLYMARLGAVSGLRAPLQPSDKLQVVTQVGLFGGKAPEEDSPTAGLPKPADNPSTQPPKAFQGQGENDTEQRMESSFSDSPPGSATQVCTNTRPEMS